MRRIHTLGFVLPVLALLLGPLCAVGSAKEKHGEETSTPELATVVVRLGPLGDAVKAKGGLEAVRFETVACKPKSYRGALEVEEASAAGAVVKGQTLVKFKNEDLTRQLEAAERSLILARNKLERSERSARLRPAESALAMEEAIRRKRLADESLTRFEKVERKLKEQEAQHGFEAWLIRIKDQREELDQLEKMYKADDLTEETEEIVLNRTRRNLERTLKSLGFRKLRHEWAMKTKLPREHENLRIQVRKASQGLERLEASRPLDDEKRKVELEGARVALRQSERNFEKLQADQEALIVKAPMAGYAVAGTYAGGKWSGLGDAAVLYAPGKKLKAGQVLFTVVDDSALRVRTAVKEADLSYVKKGLTATVTTSLTGKASFEAEVISVARYGAGGNHTVTLRLRSKDERLRTGLSCQVSIPKANEEEVLSVPVGCLLSDDGKHFLFVMGAGGQARVEVKIGRKAAGRVEIKSGLKAGQRVLKTPPADDSKAEPKSDAPKKD